MEKEVRNYIAVAVAVIGSAAMLWIVLVVTNHAYTLYRNEQAFEDTKQDLADKSDLLMLTKDKTATGNDIISFIIKHTGEYFYAIETINAEGYWTKYLLADIVSGASHGSTDDVRNGYIAKVSTVTPGGKSGYEWQYMASAPAGIAGSIPLSGYQRVDDEVRVDMGGPEFVGDTAPDSPIALKRWTENFLGNTIFRDTHTKNFMTEPVYMGTDIVGFYFKFLP